jgi:hypothetical protein
MPGAGIALRKIKPTQNGADFIGDYQGVYIYVRQGDTSGSQNFSFTSLGDLETGDRGYVALFTSETGNPGVLRDGWQQPVNEPRNLGFVHVTKGFEAVREGEWNSPEKRLGNTIIRDNRPVSINVTSCYACGPLLFGFMRQHSGDYTLPLYVSAAVAASSAIIIWLGRPRSAELEVSRAEKS